MKQRIINLVAVLGIAVLSVAGTSVLPSSSVYAGDVDPTKQAREGLTAVGGGGEKNQLRPQLKTVINVLLFIVGAVSVIMIVIGGFKYVISNGDSTAVASAKNTILYAVIGLVVALLAFAIVNFVLTSFTPGSPDASD
jgi:small-conductance mechanosensitive channel